MKNAQFSMNRTLEGLEVDKFASATGTMRGLEMAG
jgi:hypothetical protein